MLFQSARQKVGAATAKAAGTMVAPITGGRGLNWPAIKRAAWIISGGAVLAALTSNLPANRQGAAPLLCLALAFLVALCDYHRPRRDASAGTFGLLVGASAMAAFVALAAARTPFTKSATVEATTAGNQAAIAGPGMAWDGLKAAGTWTLHVALPWVVNVGVPGSVDFIRGLGS